MFGSLITAAIPLISAMFSVGAGLSLLGLLASAVTFPTTAPTIATLLGLGVAVDYGLFLVSRHREQLDTGMDVITSARQAAGTSGRGHRRGRQHRGHLHPRPVHRRGVVRRLARPGRRAGRAVTMVAALTLVPALMGLARGSVRSLSARLSGPGARTSRCGSRPGTPRPGPRSGTSTARSPAGAGWSAPTRGRGAWPPRPSWSCWPSRCSRSRSASPTTAPTRPRRATGWPTT